MTLEDSFARLRENLTEKQRTDLLRVLDDRRDDSAGVRHAAEGVLEACEPFVDGAPDSPPEVRQLGHACEVLKDALGRTQQPRTQAPDTGWSIRGLSRFIRTKAQEWDEFDSRPAGVQLDEFAEMCAEWVEELEAQKPERTYSREQVEAALLEATREAILGWDDSIDLEDEDCLDELVRTVRRSSRRALRTLDGGRDGS